MKDLNLIASGESILGSHAKKGKFEEPMKVKNFGKIANPQAFTVE